MLSDHILRGQSDSKTQTPFELVMKIRLWFIRETEKARLYSRVPIEDTARRSEVGDWLWIPRSIVEHTSKRGNEHTLELPDWFVEKEKL